jgi:TatD DNase family protein
VVNLFDTHCHIHEAQLAAIDDPVRAKWLLAGKKDADLMIAAAAEVGVTCLLCVGTALADSKLAVAFVKTRRGCWASIGLHPHEAQDYANTPQKLEQFAKLVSKPKVVAVGECGLDYFYQHSSKKAQETVLRFQIELALEHNLPLIFHVRDAFADFWPIFDSYKGIRGVIHSLSADPQELAQILERNLYVGLNGIMTFTKKVEQLAAAKAVPLDRMLLETDAPFLTPAPHRGTICEPKHVRVTAKFLADTRGETLEHLASVTTQNAHALFHV